MPLIGGGRSAFVRIPHASPKARTQRKKKQKVLQTIKLQTLEEMKAFVQSVHDTVVEQWQEKQANLLDEHLRAYRDKVLSDQCAVQKQDQQHFYPRLLSNHDDDPKILQTLYCRPCNDELILNESCAAVSTTGVDVAPVNSANSPWNKEPGTFDEASDTLDMDGDNQDELEDKGISGSMKRSRNKTPKETLFQVKMRVDKGYINFSVGSPIYLEGTHAPRPSSSATIFLKTHYATEDEQNLRYVPYFGDDDKEDVVSDLYNLEDREKLMEFGSEYRERERNDILDAILLLLQQRLEKNNVESTLELNRQFHAILADIMDENQDRIHERYELVIAKSKPAKSLQQNSKTTSSISSKQERKLETYLDAMDTYRPLFCRRCFTYDCNMHGNLGKASLELQAELAIQRERDGFWNQTSSDRSHLGVDSNSDNEKKQSGMGTVSSDETYFSSDECMVPNIALDPKVTETEPTIHKVSERALDLRQKSADCLTQVQRAVCERAFMIFQGDTKKIAITLGAPHDAVADYCELKGFKLEKFKHLKDEHIQMFNNKKRKKGSGNFWQSMNNYNLTWLKRVEDSEIHPVFVPCDHEGPCSEENCSCVRNAFFCTKHCAWERRSRNFFRGCACNGRCTTKLCSCFAAKRECDPDLCKTCGACTDPPHQPATAAQRCRNDQISMRRHCHLLLGKSQIEDAGWGIYNRYALKKGDYVHEYVGEVISQEEAERRGRIYDKVNRSYLFNLSSDFVVDASRKGNKSRFANHSSKPNCYTKMMNVNGDIRIGLYAKEDIEPQTELFFDYRYDVGIDNDLIIKPGMTVDWMKNPKMANKISKKCA